MVFQYDSGIWSILSANRGSIKAIYCFFLPNKFADILLANLKEGKVSGGEGVRYNFQVLLGRAFTNFGRGGYPFDLLFMIYYLRFFSSFRGIRVNLRLFLVSRFFYHEGAKEHEAWRNVNIE